MDNDELKEWNAGIDEIRASRVSAQETALRSRGVSRALHLWAARLFRRLEDMGRRWRDDEINDQ